MATEQSARCIARFSERLKHLKELNGLSLRDLATKTGLSIGAVRSLLSGESDPKLSTLVALASAFELYSIDELLVPGLFEVVANDTETF